MTSRSHPILSMVTSRIGLGLLSLLIVSLVIFSAVSFLPGSYASAILGQNATPEAVAAMEQKLGLNRPWFLRYVRLAWRGCDRRHGDVLRRPAGDGRWSARA
jgi:peptide/nickel transport system permease protein